MSDVQSNVNVPNVEKGSHLRSKSLSRAEMRNTLSHLISTFHEETQFQNTLFLELQQSADNDPNYAKMVQYTQYTNHI